MSSVTHAISAHTSGNAISRIIWFFCIEAAVIPASAILCLRVELHKILPGDHDILILHQDIEQLVAVQKQHKPPEQQPEAIAAPKAVRGEKEEQTDVSRSRQRREQIADKPFACSLWRSF